MIDVMQILRKTLNNEFTQSLKLSQPDIVDQIQFWSDKSEEKETKAQCKILERLMGINPIKEPVTQISLDPVTSKSNKRIYRGQVIEDVIDNHPVATQAPSKPKRMYRGQVVS